MSFLRFLMFLSLVVWIGGIIFFAIMCSHGVSLAAEHASRRNSVGNLLAKLHWIAIVSGIVYLAQFPALQPR